MIAKLIKWLLMPVFAIFGIAALSAGSNGLGVFMLLTAVGTWFGGHILYLEDFKKKYTKKHLERNGFVIDQCHIGEDGSAIYLDSDNQKLALVDLGFTKEPDVKIFEFGDIVEVDGIYSPKFHI